EQQRGRMFAVTPGPSYEDAARTYREELHRWEPIIDRLADLFLRMERDQAEIAATAHFAAVELQQATGQPPSETAVLEAVQRWKARRQPPLAQQEAARTIRNLSLLGWLPVRPSEDLPLPADALAEV